MDTSFHVGNLLKKLIVERKYTRVEITEAMRVPNTALYAYELRPSLQLSILIRLCHAMKYNLLLDIANTLPPEYNYDKALQNQHNEKQLALEEENKKLKWENDLLKEMMIKKG